MLKRFLKSFKFVLILIFVLLISFISYKLYDYYTSDENKAFVKEINTKVTETKKEKLSVSDKTQDLKVEVKPEQKKESEKFKLAKQTNSEIIAFIKINDTRIDYPVLQTKDNDFYMTRNVKKEKDRNGSIFADYEVSIKDDPDNLIIYGHHMRNKNMFHDLSKFRDSRFFNNHRYFNIEFEDHTRKYEVILLAVVNLENEGVFEYNTHLNWSENMNAEKYVKAFRSYQKNSRDVKVESKDKLLTLSTCAYEYKDGRLVIVAKEVERNNN